MFQGSNTISLFYDLEESEPIQQNQQQINTEPKFASMNLSMNQQTYTQTYPHLTNSYYYPPTYLPMSTSRPQVPSYLSYAPALIMSAQNTSQTPSHMNLFTSEQMQSTTSMNSMPNAYPVFEEIINSSLANLPQVEAAKSQYLREASRSKTNGCNTNQCVERRMTESDQQPAERSVRRKTIMETQIPELNRYSVEEPHSNDENGQQNKTSALEANKIHELLVEQRKLKKMIDHLQTRYRSNEMTLMQNAPRLYFDRHQISDLQSCSYIPPLLSHL